MSKSLASRTLFGILRRSGETESRGTQINGVEAFHGAFQRAWI
jgi:hypothetical protein